MLRLAYVIAVLLFVFALPSYSAAPQSSVRHVVFDIDWTIVAPVHYNPSTNPARTLSVNGERYRVLDGLEGMMADLHKRGVKISFFSGGDSVRNELLLKQIRPEGLGGKSLFDIAEKVLSRHDLFDRFGDRPVPKGARFWERYEKDLTRISNDLSNVVLVDDV